MTKTDRFDVVIIGAGISGLTSAALLSRAGLSVCVLERHYLEGGYLQGFERNGFIFDTAIHWLNQCGENGTVTRIFDYIDTDYPRAQEMPVIQRHIGNGREYSLTNNPDDLKNQLIKDFPEDKKGIVRFFDDAKRIAKVSLKYPKMFRSNETMSFWERLAYGIRRASIGYPLLKHIFYSGEKGMEKGLTKYFSNPKLRKLYSTEQDMLSCLFPIAWAYNNDFQNPPEGGSQAFPKWLMRVIQKEKNSEVRLSSNVTNIQADASGFKSVTYANRAKEYKVEGKYLIAACDVSKLYSSLLPKEEVDRLHEEKLNDAELYSSSVTVSIALKCPAEDLGFGTELSLIVNDNASREEHSGGDPSLSAISVLAPTTRDKSLAPEGKGTLTLYVPAWIQYENYWRTERKPNGDFVRTDAYKKLKEDFAQIIIDRVESSLSINLRDHIEFYEVATPITYYRYTHNRNGTMMGARPGKKNMQLKVARYSTSVNNIYVGGHWAELGGGVPIATKAAYNVSLIILKKENQKAFEKLKAIMEKG